jgi:protoporphyrinogen oxidase
VIEQIDNVILGGGIAGLGAAYAWRREGLRSTIFEARATAGGLLDNFTIDGFRFDRAVHLSFATEPEVREVFDRTPYITHAPEALCWDAGRWIRHPTQNNMYPLSAEEKIELIAGLADAPTGEIANYEDWLLQQYGRPIAERWPMPYTEKYWSVPARELGTEWIGQRVRKADMREVLRGAFTTEKPNHFYAKEMRYPAKGGYRAFIEPLIAESDIRCDKRAVAIDPRSRTVEFADGTAVRYESLVSTVPLPRLVEMMPGAPQDVRQAAGSLFATTVDLVSVGFRKPDVSPSLWFYIYDRDIVAARAYAPGIKSPDNVPNGCSSLQFEIYSSPPHPQTMSPEEMKANTVAGLEKMGLATPDEIVVLDHRRLDYGNVVFDLGMEERRTLAREWVEAQDVQVAGRFGEWDYLWSNQSLLSGMGASRRALARAAAPLPVAEFLG